MADCSVAASDLAALDCADAEVSARDPDLYPSQRRWTAEEKARIVSESFAPGASITSVSARHGVSRAAITRWRRAAIMGELDGVPGVAPPPPAVVSVVMDEVPPEPLETIGDEVRPVPSAWVTIEAGGVVVRLAGDSPVDRIVAVASGLRLTP